MGQGIEVTTTVIGEVAVLEGDRTLTGQDGAGFASAKEAAAADGLGARLAEALFDTDPDIAHVFTASNVATLRRPGGWDDGSVERLADVLRTFFVYYGRENASGDEPVGGTGAGLRLADATPFDEDVVSALRERHYNATVAEIDAVHDSLWIVRVRPDGEMPSYVAGQYATLGLGFWEPRLDERREVVDAGRIENLARRSYSISSTILGPDGKLLDPSGETSLEFYLVLVERDWRDTPAVLTQRLFLKEEGDRIYMGRKIAGLYRLDKIDIDPESALVFLSTGTGEAPHNRMILDLLRAEHEGPILAACTVRYKTDLAYLDYHRRLEERFSNYRYLGLTTREKENEGDKVYIQDLIASGSLEDAPGRPLDPDDTHVFLCGNPGMIGLPEWEDDKPVWPETTGAAELLVQRGFTLDRRGVEGNVHYEEYW